MTWLRKRLARRRLKKKLAPGTPLEWEMRDKLIDLGIANGWPVQWNVCAHCGEWEYVNPPHIEGPCPHVVAVMQSAGMFADSQRNLAARAGLQVDEVTRIVRESFRELGEEQ